MIMAKLSYESDDVFQVHASLKMVKIFRHNLEYVGGYRQSFGMTICSKSNLTILLLAHNRSSSLVVLFGNVRKRKHKFSEKSIFSFCQNDCVSQAEQSRRISHKRRV